ncbi:hypothetical protein BDV25DRAFT_76301 [Aspergillus avenaceus]|uniref:Peptidase M20 dimerisation domain-containing protein n=1 Tax=Aspergillus avenaceus TaxID=36643 RepID=A0A5N6U0F6_ASPAV|nr:hypothetical protein BDV25DRAFT_76301 [Aspergillus avenaceus]
MKPHSLLLLSALAAASPHPAHQSPLGPTSPESIIDASPFLSFHRDIVQIPSVTGTEHNVGTFIADFLAAHNFTVHKQAVDTGRFNIYAHPSQASNPEILVTSHIDTVPPFLNYNVTHPTNAADTVIAGRGTVDAKGSIAAQIFATLDILRSAPTAPLALLFVVGEETGGDGMRTFSTSELNKPYHTIIFGEPTDLALVSGHKGMLGFEVIATGHAAHSGYPWLGESAISAILPALSRIDQLGNVPDGLPSSPKYGKTTVNIGRVDAGVAANVVPGHAAADVAVRLAAGTPEEAREIVRAAVADATGGNPAVYAEFRTRMEGYPPQDLDVDVAGFPVTTVNYGTDVPNLEVREREDGRPVRRYLYGPGSIHVAHGDNEAVTVGDLESAVDGYRRLIGAALQRD